MVGLERGRVELEDHREQWHREYEKEVSRLKFIAGAKIKDFEHIGSTSIEGIKAKPIIDMLAVVESLKNAYKLVSVLEDNGYEHRSNGDMEDRIFLAKGPEDKRTHYLSLAEKESDFFQRTTAFRDYLNSHPAEAEKYCELKEELAKKHSDEREKYTEKKNEFIEKVTSKALREKGSS